MPELVDGRFIVSTFSITYQEIFKVLENDLRREVFLYIFDHPGTPARAIADGLHLKYPEMYTRLRKLIDIGLVEDSHYRPLKFCVNQMLLQQEHFVRFIEAIRIANRR